MTDKKTDPRVLRTRRLIMDSFISLSEKKDFQSISVKDITDEAIINRATFYYHFEDKHDLLEKSLAEVLQINFNDKIVSQDQVDERMIESIFISIADFQCSLASRCHQGYEETIARIVREHLQFILFKTLKKQFPTKEDQTNKFTSNVLSWAIYGASVDWRQSNEIQQSDYIKTVIPYLISGLEL